MCSDCMQAFDSVFIFSSLKYLSATTEWDAFQGHLVKSYRSDVDFCQRSDVFEGMAKVIEEFSLSVY